jgi:hypothetical protein
MITLTSDDTFPREDTVRNVPFAQMYVFLQKNYVHPDVLNLTDHLLEGVVEGNVLDVRDSIDNSFYDYTNEF